MFENTESKLLTHKQLLFAISSVVRSFDAELIRMIVPETSEKIVDAFMEMYHRVELYAFFTPLNIKYIYGTIFDDAVIRSFVLNITDRTSLDISTSNMDINKLYETLKEGCCLGKVNNNSSGYILMSNDVSSSFYIEKEVLSNQLKSNFWLIVLYLLLMNFHQTESYKLKIGLIKK